MCDGCVVSGGGRPLSAHAEAFDSFVGVHIVRTLPIVLIIAQKRPTNILHLPHSF